jgi:hypothetical protein|tara:strand:- start:468 stop:1169 length:702 start_codon:yes stop_codon:yes gene_type:complete
MKKEAWKNQFFFLRDRRGISVMIGYVLLVTITIIISTIMYQWLNTYIPTESLDCPDGVSVFVEETRYNCTEKILDFTIKNNGRFDIAGYFIHGTNSSSQGLATIALSQYSNLSAEGEIIFDADNNFLKPNNKLDNIFDLSNTSFGQIQSLEIIPIRYQPVNNKNRIVSCSDSKIREVISCYTGSVPCIPEDVSVTCGTWVCGSKTNNCGDAVSCLPGCTLPETCNANGQCTQG